MDGRRRNVVLDLEPKVANWPDFGAQDRVAMELLAAGSEVAVSLAGR